MRGAEDPALLSATAESASCLARLGGLAHRLAASQADAERAAAHRRALGLPEALSEALQCCSAAVRNTTSHAAIYQTSSCVPVMSPCPYSRLQRRAHSKPLQVGLRLQLWRGSAAWAAAVAAWHSTPFLKLDMPALDATVARYESQLEDMKVGLPTNEVPSPALALSRVTSSLP